MASQVEIANLALSKLGACPITSFLDDQEEARAVRSLYTQTLRAELRTHPWNCARKRAFLAALAEPPFFGFRYQYPLPTDYIRILPTSDYRDWQIEERCILSNDAGPLRLVYIAEIDDPNKMDALLVESFACRLALNLAERLTQSATKCDMIQREYKRALSEARRINAFENPIAKRLEDSWVTVMR